MNSRLPLQGWHLVLALVMWATVVHLHTLIRNPNDPIFIEEPYQLTLSESTAVGLSVYTVTATDADNDVIRYSVLDVFSNNIAREHFYLHPDNGTIFLVKSLEDANQTEITMTIRASDQRNPEHVDDSVVVITINRHQLPPIFTNEPYSTNIVDSQTLKQTIYTVRAVDQDLAGNLVFEAIGVYPAQSFFDVDRNTGNVFTRRNLKEDVIGRESYVLRVITYDDMSPRLQDTADVRITVTRNSSSPSWNQQQ